jgi:hypothetical protein
MVSALGDSDLTTEGSRSDTDLAELLRAGDAAATAEFRAGRVPRVEAYVAGVCAPERIAEATSAAFLDFFARARAIEVTGGGLDELLLGATRSAAAGRFAVAPPAERPGDAAQVECYAMPELLAAHANGERAGDEALLGSHLTSCATCTWTLTRVQEAERAFARAWGELPPIEFTGTVVDTTKARPAPVPPASASPVPVLPAQAPSAPAPSAPPPPAPPRPVGEPQPQPEPEPASFTGAWLPAAPSAESGTIPPRPVVSRRRSGGMVGALRRIGRTIRS